MNFRYLLTLAALGLLGAALRGTGFAAAKPNIVYFLIDDMGYADVGFNGCTDFKTPNFDKFARQGTVLECLYGQPVCSPTRAALLTGRYPTRTGVYNVVDWYPRLAKLAGASMDPEWPIDGRDIWPVLTQGAKSPHEEILLMGSRPGQSALRVGDWKLLVNPMEFRRPAKSAAVELYDLGQDPGERHNLAAAQPARAKVMQARLQAMTAHAANAEFHQLKMTER